MAIGEIQPNIVRKGTIYDVNYVVQNGLKDDFSLLAIDVAKILNIARENVQKYILPQLDYTKADLELKYELDNIKIKNLISKKSLNEYLSKALVLLNRKTSVEIDRDLDIPILNELYGKVGKKRFQKFLEAATEDFISQCSTTKNIIKFNSNIDITSGNILWSQGLFLDNVFDYTEQTKRMLKRTTHETYQFQMIVPKGEKRINDKGTRYIFPENYNINFFRSRMKNNKKWYISLNDSALNYILIKSLKLSSVQYKEISKYTSNILFITTLLKELFPFIIRQKELCDNR